MRILLSLVPSDTIESSYSILGEEQTNKLLDGIADQEKEAYIKKLQNASIEYELPNEDHKSFVFIYLNTED